MTKEASFKMSESIIEKRIEWVNSFESGKRWLDGVSADHSGSHDTKRNYSRAMYDFSAWAKKSPNIMIAERKSDLKSQDEAEKHRYEELVRSYRLYVKNDLKKQTQGICTAIWSFFKYNYVPLFGKIPLDDYEPYQPLTLNEIRRADAVTSLGTRCIIRFLLDSGMSREDAVKIDYGAIKDEFEANKEFCMFYAKRGKEQVHYQTFIGSNFLSMYREYKKVLERKGIQFTPKTPLLCGLQGQRFSPQELTQALNKLSKKLDFAVSPHRIRKTFETALALAKLHPILAKYFAGHKIKKSSDVESHYILPNAEDMRKAYKEVYPAINLAAQVDLEKRQQVSERLMSKIVAGETFTDEDRRDVKTYGIQLREKVKKTPKCADGENCQRIVSEGELETLLTQGWHFVSSLPSGKIVVSNE